MGMMQRVQDLPGQRTCDIKPLRYNHDMGWNVETTDQFSEWYASLDGVATKAVNAAVDILGITGPSLGRPLVDTLTGSRLPNLKELRPKRDDIRILFVFDPRRTAILLLGGSKTNDWRGWYQQNIPEAERLYDEYLAELGKEGML